MKTRGAGNFATNPERAREMGRRGGLKSKGGGGKSNPANFANNPERAREAGRKGGLARRAHAPAG